MKALHDRTQKLQGQRVAVDLAARVAGIFERFPMLCGFSVQQSPPRAEDDDTVVELDDGLCLAEVTASTPPGFHVTPDFCNRIAYLLLELMEEQPEVLELLPGRTFARILH